MEQEKTLRRDVRRSRAALRKAFIELSVSTDISKITVNQVIEHANVSRGTFYAHYTDIYDLKRNVEERFLEGYRALMQKASIRTIIEHPYDQVRAAVDYLFTLSPFVAGISSYNNTLISGLRNALEQGIYESLESTEDPELRRVKAGCIAS